MQNNSGSAATSSEDNNDESSSASSESLQLGDDDRPASVRHHIPAAANGSSDESLDLEIGVHGSGISDDSADNVELTDDEEDFRDDDDIPITEEDEAFQKTVRDSLLQPEENTGTKESRCVSYLRVMIVWAFFLGAGATAALSYLFVSDRLPLPGEFVEWLLPTILVAPYLLVAGVVSLYDRAAQRSIAKLQQTAKKNTDIVNNLFPANVRARMLKHESRRLRKENRARQRDAATLDGSNKMNQKAGNGSFNGSWISLGSRGSSRGSRRRAAKERRLKRKGRRIDTLASPGNHSVEMTDTYGSNSPPKARPETPLDDEFMANDTFDEDGLIPKEILSNKPIADFFPHCTVLFADIVGFTAWSSVRDPTAVFILLESLYSCFDGIARRLRVFKVETIGDCYVAVTGLPDPMENHAAIMAQFARACMFKMLQIVRALEKHLGPDTGDLSMRFGLHSGPVTAGVMRGEKSRFQLFGDTVNTAARIESTGERDKIHLSAETAQQLIAEGKQNWVKQRQDKVQAKGKGKLQTYWLKMGTTSNAATKNTKVTTTTDVATKLNGSGSSLRTASDDDGSVNGPQSFGVGVNGLVAMFEKAQKLNVLGERTRRQADYTVEVLSRILKKLVAQRRGTQAMVPPTPIELSRFAQMETSLAKRSLPVEDVNEAIDFASYLQKPVVLNGDKVQLPRNVLDQLEDFVTTIASMYKPHAFHCWEHASHVTISLTKLYSRLVSPNGKDGHRPIESPKQWGRKTAKSKKNDKLAGNQNAAFGIPNDAMTEFALVFAAMIHDLDHPGLANVKLVKEKAEVAQKYGKQSPTEQNSMDLAWNIFLRPAYQELRRHIYSTEEDMLRFRQLVVTLVMATDMTDRDKANERNKRWEKAFSKKATENSDTINRRATLVLETMIQVSNVAHCVQHWNVYVKWNKKLFQEMCEAYRSGRQNGQKDPADFWFQGELHFFDDVVLPLATKLTDCGAFGEDAEEFLLFGKANRRDWDSRGRDVLMDYLSEIRAMTGTRHSASTHSATTSSSLWSSDSSIKFKPPSSAKWTKPNSSTSSKYSSMTSMTSNQGIKSVSSSRPPR